MRVNDGRLMCAREHRANRVLAEIPRLVSSADFMRVAPGHDADLKAIARMRLQFLDAATRNIGSVVEPRNAIVAARAIDLKLRDVLVTRDDRGSLARETP